MIRDLSIIGFIIGIVIVGHIYVQNMIKEESLETIGKLEEIKSQVQINDLQNAKSSIEDLYNSWKEKSDNWSVLADHQEVDNIEKSISFVKSSINAEDLNQIIPKIDESIYLISLIEDREKLNLKNIF